MNEFMNALTIELLKQTLFLFFFLIGLGYILYSITKNIKYVIGFIVVTSLVYAFSKVENLSEFLAGLFLVLIFIIGLIIIFVYKISEKNEENKKKYDIANIRKELDTTLEKKVNDESNIKREDVSLILKIREELVEYRKEKSKKKNVPAYYIFNNKELDKIIELMPKTLNELRRSGIISEVKCKLHGDEIINIINNIRY